MSITTQLIAVLTFLAYSAAYLLFVAWAAEKANPNRTRPSSKFAVRLTGILLPLAGLILVLLTGR